MHKYTLVRTAHSSYCPAPIKAVLVTEKLFTEARLSIHFIFDIIFYFFKGKQKANWRCGFRVNRLEKVNMQGKRIASS